MAVGALAGLAPAAAQAQNLVDIRVPNFRAPDIRMPDVRVPDVDFRAVRAQDFRVTLPPAPTIGSGLVFHGNFCGPGNRGAGRRPVDALDAACARHDSCTPPSGALASCGCNARLQREAAAVAMSPRAPDDTRVAARVIAEGAGLMACR